MTNSRVPAGARVFIIFKIVRDGKMLLLDGKASAAEIRKEIAREVGQAVSSGFRRPGLAVIVVGDDPASAIYVRNKERACAETGIVSEVHRLPDSAADSEARSLVDELNGREDIDGILLQLPLPAGMDARACLGAIDPEKDVDGFHPINMGRLALGLPGLRPCTPAGILELLKRHNLSLAGRKAVVVGRSDIVGKPLALMLAGKEQNATVTLCHSATEDLKRECLEADYLFAAMGSPRAIGADMVREGCVVVDVGINRTPEGLCGDVDYVNVCGKASAMTPVPGGIGPMTIAMLLKNTLYSWRRRTGLAAGNENANRSL